MFFPPFAPVFFYPRFIREKESASGRCTLRLSSRLSFPGTHDSCTGPTAVAAARINSDWPLPGNEREVASSYFFLSLFLSAEKTNPTSRVLSFEKTRAGHVIRLLRDSFLPFEKSLDARVCFLASFPGIRFPSPDRPFPLSSLLFVERIVSSREISDLESKRIFRCSTDCLRRVP